MALYRIKRLSDGKLFKGWRLNSVSSDSNDFVPIFDDNGNLFNLDDTIKSHLIKFCRDWKRIANDDRNKSNMISMNDKNRSDVFSSMKAPDLSRLKLYEVQKIILNEDAIKKQTGLEFLNI